MQELRVVRLDEGGRALVVATVETAPEQPVAAYRLPVDDRLRELLGPAAASPPAPGPAPGPVTATLPVRLESRLSPREIQARLRAGVPVEEVAKAAGVDPDRVTRYEGPVLAERAHVVDLVRAASVVPGGLERVGVVVDESLQAAEPGTVSWRSHRQDTGTWLVEVSWLPGRGTDSPRPAAEVVRPQVARWSWDPVRRQARPLDRTAEGLTGLDVRPRPGPPDPHEPVPTRPVRARAGEDELALLRLVQQAPPSVATPIATITAVTASEPAAGAEPTASDPAPPAEATTADVPPAASRQTAAGGSRQRAAVPSWDDIVFGARRPAGS